MKGLATSPSAKETRNECSHAFPAAAGGRRRHARRAPLVRGDGTPGVSIRAVPAAAIRDAGTGWRVLSPAPALDREVREGPARRREGNRVAAGGRGTGHRLLAVQVRICVLSRS